MSQKLFIVTGANGFLGNVIVRKLSLKENVRCLILPGSDRKPLEDVDCAIYEGDVTRPEILIDIFDRKNNEEITIIHCASIVYTKSKYNEDVYRVNVDGVKNIVDVALRYDAKLIYVSSVHAIKESSGHEVMKETKDFNPDQVFGHYAKSKAEASRYVLNAINERALKAIILHPAGIIGPGDYGDTHLSRLVKDYLSGSLTMCVKGGYNFVDVRDVADGVINACEFGKTGETYILSNRYAEIREILDIIAEYKSMKSVKMIPFWIAQISAPILEKYYEFKKQPPLFSKYSLYTVRANSNFDNSKAKAEFNYSTRDLKDTIIDTVKWLEMQEKMREELTKNSPEEKTM